MFLYFIFWKICIFTFILFKKQKDDVHELVQISGWLNLKWTDCKYIFEKFEKTFFKRISNTLLDRLVWNSSDWKDSKTLKVPYKILWVPDIFLFDAADSISWNI
jgi:hypothetical protein